MADPTGYSFSLSLVNREWNFSLNLSTLRVKPKGCEEPSNSIQCRALVQLAFFLCSFLCSVFLRLLLCLSFFLSFLWAQIITFSFFPHLILLLFLFFFTLFTYSAQIITNKIFVVKYKSYIYNHRNQAVNRRDHAADTKGQVSWRWTVHCQQAHCKTKMLKTIRWSWCHLTPEKKDKPLQKCTSEVWISEAERETGSKKKNPKKKSWKHG